jgi:uncharacterized alpha-E superfamily protein
MLSRVADNLYWMSRYLERAEHVARLLDVHLHQMLDNSPEHADRRWLRMFQALRIDYIGPHDSYQIAHRLTLNATDENSIAACIAAARENIRQVREQVSSEMWEQLNRLYLFTRNAEKIELWHNDPHQYYVDVREGAHLFQGITDATMSHGEGWQFIQIGRYIERAQATAALLDMQFQAVRAGVNFEFVEWVALLKSCTAFEAYCKVYTADVQPDRIVEFLLLNELFPRSVRFAADQIQQALQAINQMTGRRNASHTERLAGRLRATLDYGQVDEIMADMRPYLENIQRTCAQLHTAIHQIYIAYSIEAALAS